MVEWTRENCGFIWFDKDLTKEIMLIQWRHMAIYWLIAGITLLKSNRFILAAWLSWESNSYVTVMVNNGKYVCKCKYNII
jgi:hypothetical protein